MDVAGLKRPTFPAWLARILQVPNFNGLSSPDDVIVHTDFVKLTNVTGRRLVAVALSRYGVALRVALAG
jgi:hypothetical protein